MAGLFRTGLSYKGAALSGFARDEAIRRHQASANKQMRVQEKQQETSTGTQMAGIGAAGGYLAGGALTAAPVATTATTAGTAGGALAGLGLGAWGGPIGMALGAGLGWIFSRLF